MEDFKRDQQENYNLCGIPPQQKKNKNIENTPRCYDSLEPEDVPVVSKMILLATQSVLTVNEWHQTLVSTLRLQASLLFSRPHPRGSVATLKSTGGSYGCASKLLVPFLGRCTTHLEPILVGLGCSLGVRDFDPWPHLITIVYLRIVIIQIRLTMPSMGVEPRAKWTF